jgi:hypothetical protein
MTTTVTVASALLTCAVTSVTVANAFADCVPPQYKVGQVVTDSSRETLLDISISLREFAPRRLICLAETLQRRYPGRETINIFIFSSPVAARLYTPIQLEGPSGSYGKVSGPGYSRELHAIYTFDALKHEERIDIKPRGSIVELDTDTRIQLPATTVPLCRLAIDSRCVLAMEDVPYPSEVTAADDSTTVTLSAIVTRGGKVKRIKVVGSTSVPVERAGVFARHAIAHLASLRLEEAAHESILRTTYSYVLDRSMATDRMKVYFGFPNEVTIRLNPR